MNDFQKSIKAILNDRITSPLSGTLVITWVLWNWKMLYFLIIFDNTQSVLNKISFVEENYSNISTLIFLPIASTFFLITMYPFLSIGTFWISLKFKEWQNNIKNTIEKNRLLTLDQSIQIALEIKKQKESFFDLQKTKDDEITLLKKKNDTLSNKILDLEGKIKSSTTDKSFTKNTDNELEKFLNSNHAKYFETIAPYINNKWMFDKDIIPDDIITTFIAFDLLVSAKMPGQYNFTEKGRKYLKEFLLNKNNK